MVPTFPLYLVLCSRGGTPGRRGDRASLPSHSPSDDRRAAAGDGVGRGPAYSLGHLRSVPFHHQLLSSFLSPEKCSARTWSWKAEGRKCHMVGQEEEEEEVRDKVGSEDDKKEL